jgi:RNA polymerase sigma-70 factor (ECF subfamily)
MEIADFTSQTYETELVRKMRSGDSTAMEELYNTYRDKLYSLVFERVGKDQAVAEDLVQETFLAALNSLDKFRGDSQLYTWLCSVAHHKISDFYRHQSRSAKLGKLPPSIDATEVEQIEDPEPIASSIMESEEIRHIVQQALDSLSAEYRKVLTFKYIERMPVLQISQVMGRSPKSVEGLLSRARKALRTNLTDAVNSD